MRNANLIWKPRSQECSRNKCGTRNSECGTANETGNRRPSTEVRSDIDYLRGFPNRLIFRPHQSLRVFLSLRERIKVRAKARTSTPHPNLWAGKIFHSISATIAWPRGLNSRPRYFARTARSSSEERGSNGVKVRKLYRVMTNIAFGVSVPSEAGS
jgi:hypothetical protein